MSQVNAYTYVYDENNQPEVGVEIHIMMLIPPPIVGIYSNIVKTYISGLLGKVEVSDMFVDAQYAMWRGLSDRVRFFVDVSEVDPDDLALPGYEWPLPPLVGNDLVDPCLQYSCPS